MNLHSLSDKALVDVARRGSEEAANILFARWVMKPNDIPAVLKGFRGLKVLSVTAAKHIVAAHS